MGPDVMVVNSSIAHSVIIVTWQRPGYVEACLTALAGGHIVPQEILVVDASEDDETAIVVSKIKAASYLRFPGGAGHMTTARNEGLRHVGGEVISFLDDDVRPSPTWAGAVQQAFTAHDLAAVSGRVVNGVEDETTIGPDSIGRLLSTGQLTGFFAADPGHLVVVDHGIGANMSFRRSWLARLGGFRDIFPGTAMREDTDIFLRIRKQGGLAMFVPEAVVVNYSGPHVVGRRFDLRYAGFAEHNHMILLVLNFGLGRHSLAWSYVRYRTSCLVREDLERRKISRIVRVAVRAGALLSGTIMGTILSQTARGRVERRDAVGNEIRQHLLRYQG